MRAALHPYSAAKGDRFDMPSIIVSFEEASILFGTNGNATGLGIWLKPHKDLKEMATRISKVSGYYSVYTWKDLRANYLRAIENENRLLRVVMLCIAIAAGFAILSIIYTSVSEKTKDIGILKAMGITPGTIIAIFMIKTLWISLLGVTFGVGLSYVIVNNINALSQLVGWTPFSSDLYYLPAGGGLPVSWKDAGVGITAVFCFLISFVSGLFPSLRAARINAVDSIRND